MTCCFKPLRHWLLIVSVFASLLSQGCHTTSHPHQTSATQRTRQLAPASPYAAAYVAWTLDAIHHNQQNLAAITAAAESAAPMLIAGQNLAVRGQGLNSELGSRAGGFYFYKGSPGQPGDVALLAIGSLPADGSNIEQHLKQAIDEIRQFKEAGSLVMVIASQAQLRQHGLLDEVQSLADHLLDNFAPASDALFTSRDDQLAIPTLPVANAITAWAWQAELFAAFTRLQKTPAMYQSVAIPGARERNKALGSTRFHADITVNPLPAGMLASAYLTGVGDLLTDALRANAQTIPAAVDRLHRTLQSGGQAYIFTSAHYPPYHFGGKLAGDPGRLKLLNRGTKTFLAKPGEKDAILALGYCMPPGDAYWGDATIYKNAGQGVVWLITRYDTPDNAIPPGDLVIDQHWAAGDALVAIPGYPVKVFPPSGILTEILAWAMLAELENRQHPGLRTNPTPAHHPR